MPLYDRVADLPLKIEGYALRELSRTVSSGFERVSTIYELFGAGATGGGEGPTHTTPAARARRGVGRALLDRCAGRPAGCRACARARRRVVLRRLLRAPRLPRHVPR